MRKGDPGDASSELSGLGAIGEGLGWGCRGRRTLSSGWDLENWRALPWAGLLPWGWSGVFVKSNPPTSFEILVPPTPPPTAGVGVAVTDTAAFVSLESF